MKSKILLNTAIAAAVTGLVACGGGSSSSGGGSGGGSGSGSDLSANPSFTFDQTTYVGAVEPGQSNWWGWAIAGTVPSDDADAEATSGYTNPATTYASVPYSATAVTPAASCPSSSGTMAITSNGTYSLDSKTFQICKVSGSLLNDFTMTNDVIWSLSGNVVIGNGNKTLTVNDNVVATPTLTIDSGTVFRSEAQGALIVTRGAKINAVGTAAAPIIFGSANDDDFDDRGEWGGIVIQGFAYNNKCGDPSSETYCNIAGEGASGNFGGFDNADNSGTLQYAIVAEAGFEVQVDNELNGVGFMSVGYGTTIDHIQVHNNDDDGVEFFGGAVDATHLVLTSNKDDDVDWDEGYVGNLQYGMIVKTTSNSNGRHAFELDTAGDAEESQYQESNPTVANFTALSLLDSTEDDNAGDGIHLKKGSEGQFVNMLFLGNFRNCVYIDNDNSLTSYEAAGDAEDAFVNVYAAGCGTASAVVGGATVGGSSTYSITTVDFNATHYDLDDDMAEVATSVPVVSPVIVSKEID